MPGRAAAWIAIPILLVATASSALTIGELVETPDAYANQTVTVEGKVAGAIVYLSDVAYTLQSDDDHRITVFGRGAPPAAGTRLLVTGKVGRKPPDDEFDFPPVILESERATP